MGTRLKTAGENIVWFTTSTLEAKSPSSDKSGMRTFFVLILKVFFPQKKMMYASDKRELPHTS
jgi:hypothetical protein